MKSGAWKPRRLTCQASLPLRAPPCIPFSGVHTQTTLNLNLNKMGASLAHLLQLQ